MHTVRLLLALATVAALELAAPASYAQRPAKAKAKAAGTGMAAGEDRPPRPGGPGMPGPGQLQALADFSGTLTGYAATNADQVYDAFNLNTSAGTEVVRFPRHLGQALLAAAKPGSSVTVTGFRAPDPEGRPVLHLVNLTSGGQTVRDTPPPPPATPPTEQTATVRGTVQQLLQDPRGRTNAAVLSDGTVLRLPPAAAEQLADKLKAGAALVATGSLRAAGPGEVAARPVRVVRAQTITLDGVQFLVR